MRFSPEQPALNVEKRAKILEAARKRMMHYGVAKTTMGDIAEEAGMGVGTLYLHFKNKDEIVLALAQLCREEQEACLQTILNDPALSESDKLERFLLEKFAYVRAFRSDTPHGKELIAYLVQHFPDSVGEWETRFEAAVGSILAPGVRQGVLHIPDVPEAARLLRLATSGFFLLPYLELPKYPEEEDLRQLLRWFLRCWKEGA